MSIYIPPVIATGTLRFYWIEPNSTARNLSRNASPNIFVSAGSAGLGSIESKIDSFKLPLIPGVQIQHINVQERSLEIPITVYYNNIGQLANAVEDMLEWFDTGNELNKNPGYFKVIRPDDSVRQIAAYYENGLEGSLKDGGVGWTTYLVKLLCPDPYPNDGANTVVNMTVTQAADAAIFNSGKLDGYPVWTVFGPFTNVNLYNATTNKVIGFTITIPDGGYLIIDTRPPELRNNPSVYDNTGANRLSTIGIGTPTSSFWTLVPGANHLIISFGSGTNSHTITNLTYTNRYRSLLR